MRVSFAHKAENSYFDAYTKKQTVKILPGEFFVCTPEVPVVSTTLGSCIAACLWDRKKGVGGMNHFMLSHSEQGNWGGHAAASARFSNFAMEYLINEILKQGATKANLCAKVFGGASMGSGINLVGKQNIAFVKDYLAIEGILLMEEDVGGLYGRKVLFEPSLGKTKVQIVKPCIEDTTLQKQESSYQKTLLKQESPPPAADDDVLF